VNALKLERGERCSVLQRYDPLATCLLPGSCWNFFWPWRCRRYVPPKRLLHLNRLHGITSQKMILFKFHKDWFRHSKVDGGGYTYRQTQQGDLISILQNKESRLKIICFAFHFLMNFLLLLLFQGTVIIINA
jgi:hypothetical protein